MQKLSKVIASIGLGVVLVMGVCAADMTPYAYVELHKQAMEQKVQDLNQSIVAITGFTAGTDAWIQEEARLTTRFDARNAALYESYGVSGEQYVLYYAGNRNNVERYLDAHPEDRARMEDLGKQTSILLEQYEQLKVNLLGIETD